MILPTAFKTTSRWFYLKIENSKARIISEKKGKSKSWIRKLGNSHCFQQKQSEQLKFIYRTICKAYRYISEGKCLKFDTKIEGFEKIWSIYIFSTAFDILPIFVCAAVAFNIVIKRRWWSSSLVSTTIHTHYFVAYERAQYLIHKFGCYQLSQTASKWVFTIRPVCLMKSMVLILLKLINDLSKSVRWTFSLIYSFILIIKKICRTK